MNNNKVAKFQIEHILLFFGIFVFVLTVFVILIINQNHEYLEQDENALQKYFQEFKNRIDTKFLHIKNCLNQIKISAETDLFESNQTGVKFPFAYRFIAQKPKKNYYHMDNINSPYRDNVQVSLTGSGTFRNRGLEFDKITRMGLNLADDFYALKKALPNLIYIYCLTKEKQFIHHPWVPSKTYKFEDNNIVNPKIMIAIREGRYNLEEIREWIKHGRIKKTYNFLISLEEDLDS